MKGMRYALCVSAALIPSSCGPLMAQHSVATKFADVIMEYVKSGKVYNLRKMRNLPYRVENRSKATVNLEVEIEIPQKNQLKPDYEPIPDPSWIRAVPNRLTLAPGEESLVDLILHVPENEDYLNRHFQAHIVCAAAEPPDGDVTGLAFIIALRSRLRFSVGGAGPESLKRMQKKRLYKMLNFTLEPQTQYVPGFLEPGRKYNLSKEKGVRLSVINRSPQKLKFTLKSVTPPSGVGAASGYQKAPDPGWLKIKRPTLNVPGDRIKSTKLYFEIPNEPEHRGKRYMFVIQAGLKAQEIPVEVYSRIYVNIAK